MKNNLFFFKEQDLSRYQKQMIYSIRTINNTGSQ